LYCSFFSFKSDMEFVNFFVCVQSDKNEILCRSWFSNNIAWQFRQTLQKNSSFKVKSFQ